MCHVSIDCNYMETCEEYSLLFLERIVYQRDTLTQSGRTDINIFKKWTISQSQTLITFRTTQFLVRLIRSSMSIVLQNNEIDGDEDGHNSSRFSPVTRMIRRTLTVLTRVIFCLKRLPVKISRVVVIVVEYSHH